MVSPPDNNAPGEYKISFTPPFSSPPSAAVTQMFHGKLSPNLGPDTRDNAVIVELTAAYMLVKTGDSLGQGTYRSFTFVVVGPQ